MYMRLVFGIHAPICNSEFLYVTPPPHEGSGSETRETPLAIPLMIFMTPHKPSNRTSKLDVSRIFAQHFPKLGPDLTDGIPYTTNLHVFLRPCVGSMNIIKIKNPRVNESH